MPTGHSSSPTIHPAEQKIQAARPLWSGFLQRRMCIVPTWRGWAAVLLATLLAAALVGWELCAFLTVNEPVPGGVLVIEGWAPNGFEALSEADFAALLSHQPEMVLLGTGDRQRFPHPRLLQALSAAHVGVEVMDTRAACRDRHRAGAG